MPKAGLNELIAVVALSRHRSFRLTAQELGISVSALSRLISNLEQRSGTRFFNRTTRSVSLSEAGERFLLKLEPALREIEEAWDGVNELRDECVGTIKIVSPHGLAFMLIRSLIRQFLLRYPSMRVEITTEQKPVDIVAGGYNLGVRLVESLPKDMVAIPCSQPQNNIVVAAPEYLAARGTPMALSDLTDHECVRSRTPEGVVDQWVFRKGGNVVEISIGGSLILDSQPLLLEAALMGAGLSLVGESFAAEHLRTGRLVRLFPGWSNAAGTLYLCFPQSRYRSAGTRALIKMARELAAHAEV